MKKKTSTHTQKMCPKTKKKNTAFAIKKKNKAQVLEETQGVKRRLIVPGFRGIEVASRAHTSKG